MIFSPAACGSLHYTHDQHTAVAVHMRDAAKGSSMPKLDCQYWQRDKASRSSMQMLRGMGRVHLISSTYLLEPQHWCCSPGARQEQPWDRESTGVAGSEGGTAAPREADKQIYFAVLQNKVVFLLHGRQLLNSPQCLKRKVRLLSLPIPSSTCGSFPQPHSTH